MTIPTGTLIKVPKLDWYAVRILEVERLANAFNVPQRGASHALGVEIARPGDEGIVRGHAETEMVKSRADRIERLTSVPRVLVDVDA